MKKYVLFLAVVLFVFLSTASAWAWDGRHHDRHQQNSYHDDDVKVNVYVDKRDDRRYERRDHRHRDSYREKRRENDRGRGRYDGYQERWREDNRRGRYDRRHDRGDYCRKDHSCRCEKRHEKWRDNRYHSQGYYYPPMPPVFFNFSWRNW